MQGIAIEAVRAKFPSLALKDGATPRTYLDNPAGTQVPACVIAAVKEFYEQYNANLGGFFTTSRAADALLYESYAAAARFVGGTSAKEIVVGQSMTALTFAFSRSLARTFSAGDEIVVTRMDHDANIAPWLVVAQECGMRVRWVPVDPQTWRIEPAALEDVLCERTRVVALNYASNLSGSINDVAALTKLAHRAGALVYVDAVALAPHRPIDAPALGCDFLVFSAYKCYGPHVGVLWARESLLESLYAYKVRPVPETLPEKYELGTPQLELLAGLRATIAYYEELGEGSLANAFHAVVAWESRLTARLLGGLAALPGVTVAGITDDAQLDARVPTISFTHRSIASAAIAQQLARKSIFVWSGHNFALELARSLRLDEIDGVVRIGFAHYNTIEEVDRALTLLAQIVEQ